MIIRSVWFDLGMTLVEAPTYAIYRQVLQSFAVERKVDEVKRAFYLADKVFMREYPHVLGSNPAYFMPWFLGIVNYHLKVRLDLSEVVAAYRKACVTKVVKWNLIPGAAELLCTLRARGIHTGLISNWDGSCRDVLAENGLDALLEKIVVSHEVGIEKPNPRIFEIALSQFKVAPDQTLFVGDNYYDDVVGASQCGIRCLLLAPYGRLGMEEITDQPMLSDIGEVLNYLD